MTRLTLVIACALLVGACRGEGADIVLASLDSTAKIQLLCADTEEATASTTLVKEVLPIEACTLTTSEVAEGINLDFLGAVTETRSGEVSAISVTNSRILDTNRTVPGVTAFRVGEQPTGIQISTIDPTYTYVSSFSPKSVQAVPTISILTGVTGELAPPVPEDVRFDAGPTDLALYEVGVPALSRNEDGLVDGANPIIFYRWLYAALPSLGQVAQIRVDVDPETREQTWGPITMLLDTVDAVDCSAMAVDPPSSTSDDYHRICPAESRFVKTVNTTVTCVDGAAGPAPIALTVDLGRELLGSEIFDDVLLVADANQPVIHRFELSATGATRLEPIVVGTPTIEVETTPFVPASVDDPNATQRYLYAISATDSSVLAVDYTSGSSTYGAVLPVIAGISARANEENVESRNRVRSQFSNARAIEVVSPDYELQFDSGNLVATGQCDPTSTDQLAPAQNAVNMRGVFLAVSLANGALFFLDIYDLNASCRGGDPPTICTDEETGADALASIRRHRRRFGFTPTSFISIDGTPSLQFNTAPGQLDPQTGDAANSDGPGLEFIDCPLSMFSIFGEDPLGDFDGLICTSSQVWSNFSQRWDARWEGLIPNSEGGLGLFSTESFAGEPGNWFLGGDVPFCEIGVLGPQEGPEVGGDPDLSVNIETSYGGDRVLITGELPPNRRDDPDCEKFLDVPEEIDDAPVWFPIVRAFNDELEIGPSPNPNRYTLEEVAFCYNQFTEYQIHTRNAFTVTGSETGFVHRIVPDEMTNECVPDESRPVELTDEGEVDVDTVLSGRAFPNAQYINPAVSFQIGDFNPNVALTDTTVALLNFNVQNQFQTLLLDTSDGRESLPSSMLFSEHADQLFFVDFEVGVKQIVFSPLSILQTFD